MSRRYVVLFHTGYGDDHFDLMLEIDAAGPLLTWRCPTWPPTADGVFTPLPPHRRAYLDYEGDISGGRGQVRRVDSGPYVGQSPVDNIQSGVPLTVHMQGRSLTLPIEVREIGG